MKKKTKFTAEEIKMMKEMDALSEKAQADPQIRNASVPDSLWHELKRDIREYEAEKRAKEQEQRNQELIKLGLVYERRRKYRKYYVLAATLVLTLALGITSFGGAEKIFNRINTMIGGREQEVVDSEGMIPNTYISEYETLEAIEEQLGFYPVKFNYLPGEVCFLESSIHTEMQRAHLLYGTNDTVNINYMIKPNFRDGSWGIDIEDELVEEYEIENENALIYVKKYLVEEKQDKWLIQFEHKDVSYAIIVNDLPVLEIEKIISEMYFY